jgi:hypothetical protein
MTPQNDKKVDLILKQISIALDDKDYTMEQKKYFLGLAIQEVGESIDKTVENNPSEKNNINLMGSQIIMRIVNIGKEHGIDLGI